jgi:hypothetical protein
MPRCGDRRAPRISNPPPTGQRVIGFMSGNQQRPDLMCEMFILAPTDLVDEHEIPAHAPSALAAGTGG